MAAVAALAAALAVAAGCGGGSHPQTTHAAAAVHVCKLSAKQRRLMRRLKRMIVHMHRLEAPLKTVHEQGPMPLELELNRFLLKVGFLPVQEREDLIREAKSAVGLCRDCFEALESAEPALQTKFGGSPCAPGV